MMMKRKEELNPAETQLYYYGLFFLVDQHLHTDQSLLVKQVVIRQNDLSSFSRRTGKTKYTNLITDVLHLSSGVSDLGEPSTQSHYCCSCQKKVLFTKTSTLKDNKTTRNTDTPHVVTRTKKRVVSNCKLPVYTAEDKKVQQTQYTYNSE